MTIREALNRCDSLLCNTYSQAQKISWLSQLEALVHPFILDRRELKANPFVPITADTDPDTPLLVQPPFDEIYIHFLHSRIHYHNGEPERFNNALTMFRTAWEEYANYVNREIMPLKRCFRFF